MITDKKSIASEQQNKIHIAFIMPDMGLGGVEKSLLALLDAIRDEEFRVSLLLFSKNGELMSHVPDWVEISELKGAGRLETVRRSISGILSKLGTKKLFFAAKSIYHRYGIMIKQANNIPDAQYDVAIAYKDGAATWYTAQSRIAPFKIAFIHTDFKNAGYNPVSQKRVYDKFDKIYCNSQASKESFLSILPEFSDKTDVFYNILNSSMIHSMAKTGKGYSDKFSGLRILTIGRLSHEKGIDKAIEVVARLKAEQHLIRWYIVGDGSDKNLLKKKAARLHVENDIIFLGKIENPYRLLAECDIYVQPSNYEGYCISLAEAKLFAKPIVACDFCGAREQIINGMTGIITGMSVDELHAGVEKLIKDEALRLRFHYNLLQESKNYGSDINIFCSYLKEWVLKECLKS